MQLVNASWYKLYSWIMSGAGAVALVLSVLAVSLRQFVFLERFGFSSLALALSLAVVLYRLFLFERISRDREIRIATFGLNLLFMLLSINFINSTGQLHSWFHIGWLIMIGLGGMFGGYMIVSFLALTTIYMILIATNIPGKLHLDVFSLGVLGINYIVGLASFFIWKRAYINQENQQIAKLSGALKDKQQQAEIIIHSISDGVIVTDTEGKIGVLNPAASKMTGWPANEALGIDVKLVVKLAQEDGKDLPAEQNPFAQVLKTGQQVNVTLRLLDKKANFVIASMVLSPILLPKAKELAGCIAVIRDVSTARAEENRRADFISTASHEMRTPVAAIEGYLALALNDKVSRIDTKARDYLEKAHESTQHLGKLFQDLLTSAKAEDGRLVSHPAVIELGTFMQKLADGLKFSAEKKGLHMEFFDSSTASAGESVVRPLYYVYADPDRLSEVITNLFDNAIKYTDVGKISIGINADEKVVQFYVQDTGPGIPAEDVPHLFQKFYRVDNTATRTKGGTGLGLFICKKIIELYGGRIWVESELGKGSKFYINLPRLDTAKAEQLKKTEAQPVL